MNIHQQLFHQLSMLAKPYNDHLNAILGHYNLTRPQWGIIYILFNNGPHTLVDISKYLNVEKPAITRTVNCLENQGYIKAIPSPDKRKKNIQLTHSGTELYTVIRKEIDKFQLQKLAGITLDEQQQCLTIIERIKQNFIE